MRKSSRAMRAAWREFFKSSGLSAQDEQELLARHDKEIIFLIPLLGPLFGLGVLSFSLWDLLIDPMHATLTVTIRFILVAIGALAYGRIRLNWNAALRCGFIYCTHVSALIISEYLLDGGFRYGFTSIAVCIFTVSVASMRTRDFLAILCLPTLLYVVLSLIKLPVLDFVNKLMMYVFSAGLAYIVMRAIHYFRERAFMLEKGLLQVARHDSMTGAWNRAYIVELAQREMAMARRYERPLAIAMIDIDHFKNVNDVYGHDIGDRVIKLLVDTCQINLREIDHFGRLGGEEFICVLPETDESEAMRCAERLRAAIEALELATPKGPVRFTASIGVAMLHPAHENNWNNFLKDADIALYQAKHAGRNRVVLAELPHPRMESV